MQYSGDNQCKNLRMDACTDFRVKRFCDVDAISLWCCFIKLMMNSQINDRQGRGHSSLYSNVRHFLQSSLPETFDISN